MNPEAIILALLGGGVTVLIGGYVMLRKLPWERRSAEVSDAAKVTDQAIQIMREQRDEVSRIRKQYTEMEAKYSEYKERVDILRLDMMESKNQIHKLEAQDKIKDGIIGNLRNQVTMLLDERQVKDALIADLKQKLKEIQAEYTRVVADLKLQIKELTTKNERLQAHMDRLEANNNAQADDCD